MAKKTNTKLVKDLMENSKFGAMGQIFIMEAIRFYCEFQIEHEKESIENQRKKEKAAKEQGGIWMGVDMEGWVAIAKDVKERVENNYKK